MLVGGLRNKIRMICYVTKANAVPVKNLCPLVGIAFIYPIQLLLIVTKWNLQLNCHFKIQNIVQNQDKNILKYFNR